jgi:hypothetical protein
MNDPTAKTTAEWPGVEEAAGLLNFRVGGWHDFGYANPPAPACKTIPPLGERNAEAIKGGHAAIEVIDEIVRDLYQVREQLISELGTDEDIRFALTRCSPSTAHGGTRRRPPLASRPLPDADLPPRAPSSASQLLSSASPQHSRARLPCTHGHRLPRPVITPLFRVSRAVP